MVTKIYFSERPLFITDTITPEINDLLHQRETLFIDTLDANSVRTMIQELARPEIERGVFLHPDVQAVIEAFKKELVPIQAAGGFVYTPGQEVLLIFRRGVWDLPKGKLDEGESIEECAVREVEEETGIGSIERGALLTTTYHTYHQDGQHILKESFWYLMQAPKQDLKVQSEEDIEKGTWIPLTELTGFIGVTHGSIRDVVQKGLESLQKGL